MSRTLILAFDRGIGLVSNARLGVKGRLLTIPRVTPLPWPASNYRVAYGETKFVASMAIDLAHCTDEQLAAEAARESSDGPAFVALVERFRARVWRICFRLLGQRAGRRRRRPGGFSAVVFASDPLCRTFEICHLGPCDCRENLSGDAAQPRAAATARKRRFGRSVGGQAARPSAARRVEHGPAENAGNAR